MEPLATQVYSPLSQGEGQGGSDIENVSEGEGLGLFDGGLLSDDDGTDSLPPLAELSEDEGIQVQVDAPTLACCHEGEKWYDGGKLVLPSEAEWTSLERCRHGLQEMAREHGFGLVQKKAGRRAGKATFVCGHKGIRKESSRGDNTLNPDERRAKPHTHSLPGEDLCPFQ